MTQTAFGQEARANGAHTVQLNLEPTDQDFTFDDIRSGQASEIVPQWVTELLDQ